MIVFDYPVYRLLSFLNKLRIDTEEHLMENQFSPFPKETMALVFYLPNRRKLVSKNLR